MKRLFLLIGLVVFLTPMVVSAKNTISPFGLELGKQFSPYDVEDFVKERPSCFMGFLGLQYDYMFNYDEFFLDKKQICMPPGGDIANSAKFLPKKEFINRNFSHYRFIHSPYTETVIVVGAWYNYNPEQTCQSDYDGMKLILSDKYSELPYLSINSNDLYNQRVSVYQSNDVKILLECSYLLYERDLKDYRSQLIISYQLINEQLLNKLKDEFKKFSQAQIDNYENSLKKEVDDKGL